MVEGPVRQGPDQAQQTISRINVEKSILDKTCPYTVVVNEERFKAALIAFHIPPETANFYSLYVQRDDPPELSTDGGYFTGPRKEIHICTDKYFDRYRVNSITAADLIENRNQYIPFLQLVGDRLSHYLKTKRIPIRRKREFAERLLQQAMQRDVARVIAHEIAHAAYELGKISTYVAEHFEEESAVHDAFTKFYADTTHRDDDQRLAIAAGDKLQFDPRFDGIVTILPKKPQVWEHLTKFRKIKRLGGNETEAYR